MKFIDYQKVKELDPHTQILIDSPSHGTKSIWFSDLAKCIEAFIYEDVKDRIVEVVREEMFEKIEEAQEKLLQRIDQLEQAVQEEKLKDRAGALESSKTELDGILTSANNTLTNANATLITVRDNALSTTALEQQATDALFVQIDRILSEREKLAGITS